MPPCCMRVAALPLAPHPQASAADHVWFRQLPAETSLTLSETIANLELMEARGVVARDLVDGAYRFR